MGNIESNNEEENQMVFKNGNLSLITYSAQFHWNRHQQFLPESIVKLFGSDENHNGHTTGQQSWKMSLWQQHNQVC